MDLYIFQQINQFVLRWFWLDVLIIFFARYFEYFLLLSLLLFLAVGFRKYWKMVFQSLIAAFISRFIIVSFIRFILERPRPFVENNVNLLLEHSDSASFPSGHASFYFALATVVFLKDKKIGSLFFLGAFLISLSRVFVGIHWPSDILAGAIIGILSGWLIAKFSDKTI